MSNEIKIQESPAPEQGAQTPLSTDAANGRTRGTDCGQNNLSFCRGSEVEASSHSLGSRNGLNSDAAQSGVAVSIKLTSANHLEGSNQGDHRAQAAPAVLPANPSPREGMGQTPNGRNCRS